MNKTKIEWCDFTINPVKGLCPIDCKDNRGKPYCYARRIYKWFKWNPEIRFEPIRDDDLPKTPSRIFVGSTIELFGEWVDAFWMDSIFRTVKDNPQHIFIFLTKQPQNFAKWSPFPDNCWVGVSTCNQEQANEFIPILMSTNAKVRFVSIEPMLSSINLNKLLFGWEYSSGNREPWYINAFENKYIFGDEGDIDLKKINWLIIGQQTPVSVKTQPKISWISKIVEAADKAGVPVFLKDNILDIINCNSSETAFAFDKAGYYRQEITKLGI